MRAILLLTFALLLSCPTVWAAADSVRVTNHVIAGLKSKPGLGTPDIIIVKLEVEYLLLSAPKAVLKFAVDEEAEMSFVTVDEKEVVSQKRRKTVEVVARLDASFSRDLLRGVILLQEPEAEAGSKPLAMTGISLDVKKFKNG